jgi:ABC-2 type transport system permease protein
VIEQPTPALDTRRPNAESPSKAKLSGVRLSLDRILAVCGREYSATVRTKTFVAAVLLLPMVVLGSLLMPLFAELLASGSVKRVAIIDETGVMFERLEARFNAERAAATARGSSLLPAPETASATRRLEGLFDQGPPPLQLERIQPTEPREQQLLTLSDAVRREDLLAFAVIEQGAIDEPREAFLRYYTNSPTYGAAKRWLLTALQDELSRLRLEKAGVDAKLALDAPGNLRASSEALFEQQATGVVQLAEPDAARDIGIPLGLCILMFISVLMSASPLMQGVLEEKMNRIAEVLVSSVSPTQLMLGKLLSALFVSYSMLFIYLATLSILAGQFDVAPLLTPRALITVLVAQGVAVLTYGSVFLAVGSACNDLKESQALMMPVMGVITAPLLLLQLVLADPNGPFATIASLLPFFSPVLLMLRTLVPPGPDAWEVVVGVFVSLVTAAMSIAVATRIFRVGMLAQGGIPSYRKLLGWVLRG